MHNAFILAVVSVPTSMLQNECQIREKNAAFLCKLGGTVYLVNFIVQRVGLYPYVVLSSAFMS